MVCIGTFMVFILTDQTPLHVASGEGHDAVVQQLLDKGAEVNVKDKSGKRLNRGLKKIGPSSSFCKSDTLC